MKISYALTVGDYVVFYEHHHANSSVTKTMINNQRYGFAAGCVLVGLLSSSLSDSNSFLAATVVVSVVWLLASPGIIRRSISRNTRSIVEQGLCNGSIGPHELSITDRGVVDATPHYESLTLWSGVDRAVSTATHVFVYVGPNGAYVIPASAFANEQARTQFVALIGQRART